MNQYFYRLENLFGKSHILSMVRVRERGRDCSKDDYKDEWSKAGRKKKWKNGMVRIRIWTGLLYSRIKGLKDQKTKGKEITKWTKWRKGPNDVKVQMT